jgi:hypothetical protein
LQFPELPVFLNPLRRAFHRLGKQAAAIHSSIFSARNEFRALKHTQMFRYGRKGHFVGRSEIANRGFALREPCQDAATSGVGKRCKSVIKRG